MERKLNFFSPFFAAETLKNFRLKINRHFGEAKKKFRLITTTKMLILKKDFCPFSIQYKKKQYQLLKEKCLHLNNKKVRKI